MQPSQYRHIVITGATSGIGCALARFYARPGVRLTLCGRDADRLNTVARAVAARGCAVDVSVLDVTDRARMARWIAAADHHSPIDLVIANAGISGGSGTDGAVENANQARDIFAVNLGGVLNTAEPAITHMMTRRAGQIAIVSSLAAYRGMPSAPAYGASKAAVKSWGEGMRVALADQGIKINVICPGFVVSRITAQNTFHMPMLMTAMQSARNIDRGLRKNQAVISYPAPMALAAWFLGAMPMALAEPLLKRLPKKG